MDMLISVLSSIFWGLVVLSVLVGIHEGGHFLASRACGVRVTEFFLGLPCRFNLHHVSRRIGTKFGVTPILLGGYAMVCGMDPEDNTHAASVLGLIHAEGVLSVEDIAQKLNISEDDAMESCIQLMGWGSIAPVYDEAKGEKPSGSTYPTTYASMPRDHEGNTIYDGRAFKRDEATKQGEGWRTALSDEQFLERERTKTYAGLGWLKRVFILIAGIGVNIIAGFLLLMSIYMVVGVPVAVNSNVVGPITAASPAADAGIQEGDTILSFNGMETTDWSSIEDAAALTTPGEPFDITYEHEGVEHTSTLIVEEGENIGISAQTTTYRLGPVEAARVSFAYVAMTGQSIAQLVNPAHTLEVLNNSTSIVGISVISAQAAAEGPTTLLRFAALISFSLGFMNLLPIPPLDGGKILIETIQAIIRRPLSVRVQNAVSIAGIALFGFLFLYLLRGDILRFIL